MLKRISVADLRLGMHLHALDGSWLAHPFWRTKFVLTDPADLAAVQGSGVGHCFIDPEKGGDVVPAPQMAKALAANPPAVARVVVEPAPAEVSHSVPVSTPVPEPTASFEDEMQQAVRLAKKSKAAVQQMFGEVRLGKAVNAEAFKPLVEELTASVFRNPGAFVSLVRLKTKDDYSYMHSVAVCALMVSLSREMGADTETCREAGLAGLLHDVGKALMPLEVLNKPGKLTDAEFDVMRSHPVRGHAVLAEGGTAGNVALDVCLHHHERFDGSGYPHKLAGEGISRVARMGAICDVYDAVSSTRPYKAAWDPADSISKMASWKGHFDPTLFALFVKSLGIYPTGSLVRLRSGRLAVVTRQHTRDLTTPTVKAFFSTKSNMPIAIVEIDLSRGDTSDAILGRESRSQWNFPHLDTLWAGEAGRR